MADTRKDKRAPLSLKVRFKSATLDEFVEQYSYDISRGGIFIKSKKPMKVGTLLKFEFQLKDESSLIHGVGRVVWRREPEEGGPAPGMGIKFIKMDPESRAFVQRIVEERGDTPGNFDAGEGGVVEKKEEFFPTGGPTQQIDPEDRTQVRHASEFLAEALSETAGAAEEAQASAEAARRRTEEIQRAREEEERARKAEEEAAREREKAQAEQARAAALLAKQQDAEEAASAAEAAASAAEAAEEAEAEAASDGVDATAEIAEALAEATADTADDETAAAPLDADAPPEAAPEEDDKAAAVAAPEPEAPSAPKTPAAPKPALSDAPPPAQKSKGGLILGLVAVAALAGGAYVALKGPGGEEPLVPPTEANPGPDELVEPAEVPETEPSEADPTGEVAEDGIGEAAPEELEVAGVDVQVTSNVPVQLFVGCAEVAGSLRCETPVGEAGEEPTTMSLAPGVELTATARGYAAVTLTVAEGEMRFDLEALPWVVALAVTPDSARVQIDGRAVRGTEHTLRATPGESITVSAVARGYDAGEVILAESDFQERDGAMRATATVTLAQRARPEGVRPRMVGMTTMETAMEAEATMEPTTESEPTMESAPTMEEAPTMESAPEPTMEAPAMEATPMDAPPPDTVPENPF